MKITQIVLFFALSGHTSARLNADGVEQDQRALQDNNATEDPFDIPMPEPVMASESQVYAEAPPQVADTDQDDDDEIDVLVNYKNDNGKAKAQGIAKKINQDLRLGTIVAMTATKRDITDLALDDDIEAIDVDSQLTSSYAYDRGRYISQNVFDRDNWKAEFVSYGIPFTQSDSTVIPSNDSLGDCTNPNVFKVAIIDSGYMVNHVDSPCATNPRYGTSNCIGYSFVEDPWDAPYHNWHGTHVMGIIGAKGNSGKYTSVGVIPVQNDICYVIYRVTPEDSNDATWSNVLAAVDKAVLDEKVDVINMSLGGPGISGAQEYFTRAHEEGTLIVAASGNDGAYMDIYPSSYNDVISVGAIDPDKGWAEFVNYLGEIDGGSNCNWNVDMVAPGTHIWSSVTPGGFPTFSEGMSQFYGGTSMAAPFVSGAIAKVWSQCRNCSNENVEACLKHTADYDSLDGDKPQCYGNGLVQAEDLYLCLTRFCC